MVARPFRGHCDESRLRSFLDDRLPESEGEQLTDHLDRCEPCRLLLERLAAGSRLWAELRGLAAEPGAATPARPPATESVGARSRGAPKADEPIPLDFLAPPADPESLGRLGPYDVTEVLGRGAFGVVLKAFDPALSRFVAIKVLSPELAAGAAARGRFAREARAAAAVVHENVVAIHAVDSWNGLPYLVMPCIAGRSLQERVDRDGPLAVKEILRVGMQAALGLAAAHDQGLVHRDIKPSNILLENGVERVKLSDFGLARAVDDASQTQSGVVAGTPQYMSPEQARSEAVDHRSDLFGLGGVLYFMGAGHPPFRADSTPAVLRRVCDDRHRPLRAVNPDIPDWLAEIVDRLLAKEPGGRFSSADEVAAILRHHLAALQRSGTSVALRPTPPAPTRKRLGRGTAAAAVLTLVALSAAFLSGMPGRLFALQSSGGGGHAVAPADDDRPSEEPIVGSGRSASKDWDVADFAELEIGSTFRAEITRGDGFKVTTSSDDNLIPHIRVVKEGKTLKLGLEPGRNYRPKEPLKAEVTLPTLDGLDVGGASSVKVAGFRSEADFRLRLRGASTIEGSIEMGSADVEVEGASTLTLRGSARAARLSVEGSSHLELAEFPLRQCEVELEGSSSARLAVQSDQPFKATLSGASTLEGSVDAGTIELDLDGASGATLRGSAEDARITADGSSHAAMADFSVDADKVTIVAEGSSSVELRGKAESAVLEATGGSHLRLAGLVIGEARVSLSGQAHATVDVRKSLEYELSSGSKLAYSGAPPIVTGSESGGATIGRRP